MDGLNDLKFRHYYAMCQSIFETPINGRIRAENWMKAGCGVLMPTKALKLRTYCEHRPKEYVISVANTAKLEGGAKNRNDFGFHRLEQAESL